ncbi:helix-turn-helix transcriptional regulator [Rhizobium sp. FKY42]|uniref:helix-turn-helix domain-containing protein n=1 Tax=Rhizobium sp. FKY42 TaxID=2562310 RepID=UPI0014859A7F|nr:helix-turn-helix transcriptional regulator [Rhizobium sp. FKY42]
MMRIYLKEWRTFRGYRLKQVAALAGYTVQHLSNVENGRGGLSQEAIERLAAVLGCSVTDLMSVDPTLEATNRLIKTGTAQELAQLGSIFHSLAKIVRDYPERLPLALQAAQRLVAHSRTS